MKMKLSLKPMLFLALECTECGRPISKPGHAALDDDITNQTLVTTGRSLEQLGKKIDRCPKCGRSYYRENRTKKK